MSRLMTEADHRIDEEVDDGSPLPVIKLNFDILKKYEEISERAIKKTGKDDGMDEMMPTSPDPDEDDIYRPVSPTQHTGLGSPPHSETILLGPRFKNDPLPSIRVFPQPMSPPARNCHPSHQGRQDFLQLPIPLAPPPLEDGNQAWLSSKEPPMSGVRSYGRRRITAHDFFVKLKTGMVPSSDDPTILVVDEEPLKSILSKPKGEERKSKKRIKWADDAGAKLETITRIPNRSELVAKYGPDVFYNPHFNPREHYFRVRGLPVPPEVIDAIRRPKVAVHEARVFIEINSKPYKPKYKPVFSKPILDMQKRYQVTLENNKIIWARIRGERCDEDIVKEDTAMEPEVKGEKNQLPKCLIDLFKPTNNYIAPSIPQDVNLGNVIGNTEHPSTPKPLPTNNELFQGYFQAFIPGSDMEATRFDPKVPIIPNPPFNTRDFNWRPPIESQQYDHGLFPPPPEFPMQSRRPPLLPTPNLLPRKRPLLPTPIEALPRKVQRNHTFRYDRKPRREDMAPIDGPTRRRNDFESRPPAYQIPQYTFRPPPQLPQMRPNGPPIRLNSTNPHNDRRRFFRPRFQKRNGGRMRHGTQIRH